VGSGGESQSHRHRPVISLNAPDKIT
jgi:hypothetical protein